MKRLRRIIFNALTVLSLMLCLATVGLWARSYKLKEFWIYHRPGAVGAVRLISSLGRVNFDYIADDIYVSRLGDGLNYAYAPPEALKLSRGGATNIAGRIGFEYRSSQLMRMRSCLLPLWFLTLLASLVPAVHLLLFLRKRRKRNEGCCHKCNYDLRATPNRCPECGTVRAR